MKVLQVGSNSIHVKLFVKAMKEHGVDSDLLSEEMIDGFNAKIF